MTGGHQIDIDVHGSRVRAYKFSSDPDDKPNVVLLHGLGNTSSMWGTVPALLQNDLGVLAIDIPGFGGSATPKGGLNLDNVTRQVNGAIASQTAGPHVLVGHSLGGIVALSAAGSHPLRPKVVLVAGFPAQASELLQRPMRAVEHPLLAANLAAQFAGATLPDVCGLRTNLLSHRTFRSIALRSFVARPGDLDSALLADALSGTGGLGALRVLKVVNDYNLPTLLAHVDSVALIVGSQDRLHSPTDLAFFSDAAERRLLVMGGVGHWPQLEAPERLAALIRTECEDVVSGA